MSSLGLPSLNRPPPSIDAGRGFGAACAAFFLTAGDHEDFLLVFADFLRAMTAPTQYGVRQSTKYNSYNRRKEDDVYENVDSLKLPPKRIIRNLKTALIGDDPEEVEADGDGNITSRSDLEHALQPLSTNGE